MSDQRDPVEAAADGSRDLYDVATWEERTSVDGAAVALYWLLTRTAKWIIVLLALTILVGIGGLAAFTEPAVGMLTLLSVVPALALTLYVYRSDVTTREPLSLLVTTFILSILFATFAAIVNTAARDLFAAARAHGLQTMLGCMVESSAASQRRRGSAGRHINPVFTSVMRRCASVASFSSTMPSISPCGPRSTRPYPPGFGSSTVSRETASPACASNAVRVSARIRGTSPHRIRTRW